MTMDAVLATIVAGGRARFQSNIEVDINKLIFLLYFIESIELLRQLPWKNHAQGRTPLRRRGFIKSTLSEGLKAPSPG